ncbi:hypothetical protein MTR67_011724 [Solanum verrucosum]|uniref:Retrotransposon gag domain-containing protein n=1 Tax=Solanum verrucosum TaxID=315347 RepID=A0AAF0TGV2_SOLVR|nr:hypothetical protein MTR67_011724 [Solanum verrucosum]
MCDLIHDGSRLREVSPTDIRDGEVRCRDRNLRLSEAPARGHTHGAAPVRGRAREASPKPFVEVAEDQVPPEFGYPLFQETLFRMLGVCLRQWDHLISLSMMEESRLRFESLTQGNFSIAEYEAHFCKLSRHVMTITWDEELRVGSKLEDLIVRAEVVMTHSGPHHSYSTALARDSAPLANGRGRGQSGSGGRTNGKGAPAPQGGGTGSTQTSRGREGQRYTFLERPEANTSDVVVPIYHRPNSILFDPGSTLHCDLSDARCLESRVDRGWDIDFAINLELGTNHISIPHYRMAPAESKELKDQLHDLLSKGFIRSSVPP